MLLNGICFWRLVCCSVVGVRGVVMGFFCLICDACSCRCSFMDTVFRHVDVGCWFLGVYPVESLSAVFCVFCSLFMPMSAASGGHMVDAYSSMGIVMALYVVSIVPFCFPQEELIVIIFIDDYSLIQNY